MAKREMNMGSSGENLEQKEKRGELLREIDRLIKETPETRETLGALVVLNSLAGAMHMNEENELASLMEKFNEEALARINQKENEQN